MVEIALQKARYVCFLYACVLKGFFPFLKIHFSLLGRLLKGRGKGIRARDRAQGKYVFIHLITLQVWKCGNVEMCFSCFNLITLEVCKSEMWKSGKCLGCLLEGGTWDNFCWV